MSMVQELISAVVAAERQIDDQIGKLTSYKSQIDSVAQRIEASLSGSQEDYANRMIAQLAATKSQVEATLGSLQAAKEKLLRVRMI